MNKLLVLDLDETLFHTPYASEGFDWNYADFEICDTYPAFERPYVHDFLHYVFANFEVAVWTSADEDYAKSAVKLLFTDNGWPEPLFVYTGDNCARSSCVSYMPYALEPGQFMYIKDIKKLKKFGFPKSHILAIDDSPEKWQRSYGNYIRIAEFCGQPDKELLYLIDYLDTIKDVPNVRNIDKRSWKIRGKKECLKSENSQKT